MKQGIITKIEKNELTIQATCQTACAMCHQKKNCSLSEHQNRLFIIKVLQADKYHIGQQVKLTINPQSIIYSICLAYILPLIYLLIVMGILNNLGYSETICAVVSLLSLSIYYIILKSCQSWFEKRIKFEIKEISVD